ncbi:MAG: sugar transferase, partial [Patescibacteria group bacterium]
ILLAGDIIILYLSLCLTLILRYSYSGLGYYWPQHFWPFTALFLLWLILWYISNLYDLTLAVNNFKFYSRTAKALFFSFLLGAAFFYLMPQLNIAPKRNLLIDIAITAILFLGWRQLYNLILKSYLPKNNIAIIGLNQQVKELIKYFNDHPHLGLNIAFIFYDEDIYAEGLYNIPLLKNMEKIKERLIKERVSTVVLVDDMRKADALRSHLFNCLHLGIDFINLPHFYEKISGKVPLESLSQTWFLENLHEGGKLWFDKLKRLIDIILAALVFIISLPLWLPIAFIISWESYGPVFYKQERVGKNNKIIYLKKFRTMTEEGNTRRPTVPNDPRITRFGRLLRKTRLDELPQVLNIIKGEMSIIGPRPERPEIAKSLQTEIPFYNERTLILPGATGWDQVCGEYHSPSVSDTLKKLQYDLYYIKNRSLFLDLLILLKTIRTVLFRKGV